MRNTITTAQRHNIQSLIVAAKEIVKFKCTFLTHLWLWGLKKKIKFDVIVGKNRYYFIFV